ncbi:hypothetical protein MMC08_007812 [Hypocenomyce scalaris]|nr:hypothetical protein [Hypocenomyce scalaris]
MSHKAFKLASGYPMPALGFGTWAAGTHEGTVEEWCEESTLVALKHGYRYIDTATIYKVEAQIGAAVRRCGIPREEIFVTTKFWNQWHEPEAVVRSLNKSLTDMGLDYVDMLLMHWPVAFKHDEDMEILYHPNGKPIIDEELTNNHVPTWRAMESLVDSGKVRSIGVSNFNVDKLKVLLPHVRIPISTNQVEAHPWLPNNELLAFCQSHDILLTAYSPLGGQNTNNERLVDDPAVKQVAKRSGLDVGQVLLSWAVQRATAVVAKSAKESRIISNMKIEKLSQADVEAVDNIHKSKTVVLQQSFEEDWDLKIF